MNKRILAIAAFAAAIVAVGCGNGSGEETSPQGGAPTTKLTGSINIDGSTTVYPIASIMGEDFHTANGDVTVTVNKAGTGSGFKKFIAGEIDIVTASRPIKEEEDSKLKEAGIEYLEVPIAFDGLTLIVNKENAFAKDFTVEQLTAAWGPKSTVKTWKEINPAFPADPVTFYGPTDNHGTYEYFTETICKEKNAIRKEYQPNQEYNAIVQAVAGDKGGFGYVGINYYEENKDKVGVVSVNGVVPSVATVEDGTYTPLSRPLFIYVNKKAYERPEVKAFVEFALGAGVEAVAEAKYVKLPEAAYEAIRKRATAGTAGSVFMNAASGMKLADVLAKESGS